METAEKEGGLPVFDTDILKHILPTAEITGRLRDKIGTNRPAMEGLTL